MQAKYGATDSSGVSGAPKGGKLSDVSVLVLFCVFTISIFAVLMFSVNAYQNIHTATLENHDERIALSFVWTKIKSADSADNVSVQSFHGIPALFIDEMIGGSLHHTIIYHYDGWINELFFESGGAFSPRDGVRIIENSSLAFEQLDNGIIKVTADSKAMFISPLSVGGRGVAG
jgi:hypothetical protein